MLEAGNFFSLLTQWKMCVDFFIRIRFLSHFSLSFFSSSFGNDWLSQCPTAKIYVKCVESLKSLKCLDEIVLNHFRSVSNIYTIIIATPISPSLYLLFNDNTDCPVPPHDDFIHLGWMDSFTIPHSHTQPASPHTMHHCQIRNWLNTSRLHQMTSFPNFLICYNLDFLHRFTWFFVEFEFAKGIFLSYFLRLVLLVLLLLFVCSVCFCPAALLTE